MTLSYADGVHTVVQNPDTILVPIICDTIQLGIDLTILTITNWIRQILFIKNMLLTPLFFADAGA